MKQLKKFKAVYYKDYTSKSLAKSDLYYNQLFVYDVFASRIVIHVLNSLVIVSFSHLVVFAYLLVL